MVHMMNYMKEIRDSLLADSPDDTFMFQRKIDFVDEDNKKGTAKTRFLKNSNFF